MDWDKLQGEALDEAAKRHPWEALEHAADHLPPERLVKCAERYPGVLTPMEVELLLIREEA